MVSQRRNSMHVAAAALPCALSSSGHQSSIGVMDTFSSLASDDNREAGVETELAEDEEFAAEEHAHRCWPRRTVPTVCTLHMIPGLVSLDAWARLPRREAMFSSCLCMHDSTRTSTHVCSQGCHIAFRVRPLFWSARLRCRVEQQRFQSEMDKLQHALEAKEAQMQRVVSGTGQVSALKQHYDRVLTDLAGERDLLQADRTRLLQVYCTFPAT